MRPIVAHAFMAAIAVPVSSYGGLGIAFACESLPGKLAVTALSSALAACNIFPRPTGRKFLALPLAAPLLSTVIAKISSFVCRKLKVEDDLAFSLETLINTIGITTLLVGGLKKRGYNPWVVGIGISIGLAKGVVNLLFAKPKYVYVHETSLPRFHVPNPPETTFSGHFAPDPSFKVGECMLLAAGVAAAIRAAEYFQL